MSKGWECPKCGSVFAPFVSECSNCKPPKVATSGFAQIDISCNHDWDHSILLTSNPPKVRCRKCNEYKIIGTEPMMTTTPLTGFGFTTYSGNCT